MRTPTADRPAIPAGYLEDKRLPWTWAEKRLIRSRSYWLTTITTAGRPHCRPYWGVWLEGRLYFSTGSRIRAHIQQNAEISLNLESADECVIVEGTASVEMDPGITATVADAYNRKYDWDMQAEPGEFFAIEARLAFGWVCDGSGEDGGAIFQATATRWKFAAS